MPEKVGFYSDSGSATGDTFKQAPLYNIYKDIP